MILFRPCRCEMLVSVYPESTTLRPSNRRASDATIGVFVRFVSWKNMKNKLQVISKSNATKFHFLPQSWQGTTTPNERKLLLEGTISHFHDYKRKGKKLKVSTNFVFLHTSLSFILGFRCISLAQRSPKRFPKSSPENPSSTWEIAWLDALSHWLSLGDWMCGGKISFNRVTKLAWYI